MKNTELKFLANLAKQRLMNKDYLAPQPKNRNKASSYFIQNAKALRKLKAETNYITIDRCEDIEFVDKLAIPCFGFTSIVTNYAVTNNEFFPFGGVMFQSNIQD